MSALTDLAWILWPLAVVVTLVVSAGGVFWLSREEQPVRSRLQERFLLGVPWGSVLVIVVVLAIYLFVQGGIYEWDRPVFFPFVNWSYLYPTGVLLASFTHASGGHIVSNLATAAVLGPLAEYIWGHYPRADATDGWWARPWVRALVLFPGCVFAIGLVASLFAWGPVIGFSGVVFAFAGFTVVRYPLGTIVALAGRSALRQLGRAVTDPVIIAEVEPTISPPAWVGISVQGHAFGFLLGAMIGIVLLQRRTDIERPSVLRLWLGTSIVAFSLGMWAIWRSRGDDVFVLYQGVGVALLLGIALLLTVAAVSTNRPLWGELTRRQAAILTFAIPVLVLALIAIPFNILTVADHDPPDRVLSVADYDVYYAEEVEGQLRPVLPIPGLDDTPRGTASGVIVVSESRHIWTQAISRSNLAFEGEGELTLGGIGWRADVHVTRHGWNPAGNESVYRITIADDARSLAAFASPAKEVEPTVAAHVFTLEADDDGFFVSVEDRDGERDRHAIPHENETIDLGELTIVRTDDRLIAEFDGTSVPIAEREKPQIDVGG